MKLTIINDDKAVYINSISFAGLLLTSTPNNVHALQWNVDNGWIEYDDGQPNESITMLPTWADEAIAEYNVILQAQQAQAVIVQPIATGTQDF